MGSLWWCALATIASAQRLDVWSPQNNLETSERDVTLGFTGTLPEGDRAEAYRVCVALDGEPMTCNQLDVMAREQLVLTSLLPGKRSLLLTMFSDDVEVASATTQFSVGVGSGNVDIRGVTGSTTEWDRGSYFSTVYDLGYWAAQNKMPGVPASGPGSTLDAAKNAITTIEQLIREFDIELLIDAPCGDMTWMASVDLRGVEYVGIDVVQSGSGTARRDARHLVLRRPVAQIVDRREVLTAVPFRCCSRVTFDVNVATSYADRELSGSGGDFCTIGEHGQEKLPRTGQQ